MSNVANAEKIARSIFKGMKDRSGNDMILHTERVAQRGKTTEERLVGWLHDIVEDTAISLENLREYGFEEHIVIAVDHLSRRENETYKEFIQRISNNKLATFVKINDLSDNLNRCRELPGEEGEGLARRYTKALNFLGPLAKEYRQQEKNIGGR